jgi:biopolymer transport protein ExbB/TolQ
MDKKRIMILMLLCLIVVSIVIIFFNPFSLTKVDKAINYLTNHYNPAIELIFESEDAGLKNFY